jgi:uncharacterized membrane protein
MNKTRLEAFSDGVLAIIITIMVLEIKMPHEASWEALKPLLPVFVSYLLSFVYVGIYWGNHHHILHTVKRITSGMIWANMNLLFWLSLIPLATGWMGENHFAPNTVVVYAVLLLLCGISFTILQYTIMNSSRFSAELEEAFSNLKVKGIISVICYTAAIPLAFVHTLISGTLFALVSAIWLIPDKKIENALKKISEEEER